MQFNYENDDPKGEDYDYENIVHVVSLNRSEVKSL